MTIDDTKTESRPQRQTAPRIAERPRSRWRLVGWVLVLAVVAGAIGWVAFRPHGGPQAARAGRFGPGGPTPVVAAPVQKGDVDIVLNGLGTVTPLATVTVKTQIAGQLVDVGFREGQTVNNGDFLAQIDPRPYQRQLDQYQGQLQRDEALLKDAQLNLERYRTLVAQDSIAKQQLTTQQSLVQQYIGAVATDHALIDTAKLNLTYCHIVSPVGGRVGLRQVDRGNYVQPTDANGIVVITQLQPITVIFILPEDYLPQVIKELRTGAVLTATAYDRSHSTKLAVGKLMTIDNQIDPTTGTVKLRAQFDNEEGMLFPNQFVNVDLLVSTLRGTTTMPTAAIQRGAPGTFVYLVKEDSTVTVRPVKLGPISAGKVAVTSGLEPGDQVVVDGADRLREGAKISLPAAAPANGQGPAGGQPADGTRPPQNGEHRKGDGEHRRPKDQ